VFSDSARLAVTFIALLMGWAFGLGAAAPFVLAKGGKGGKPPAMPAPLPMPAPPPPPPPPPPPAAPPPAPVVASESEAATKKAGEDRAAKRTGTSSLRIDLKTGSTGLNTGGAGAGSGLNIPR